MTSPGGVEYWSGRRYGWRYLAFRVDGTGGPRSLLDGEVPLQGAQYTDVLSGPPQLSGTIEPRFARLLGPDGVPIFQPWKTAIFAEQNGVLRGGGLLVASAYDGPSWSLDVSGFCGYLGGQPYEGNQTFVNADPLSIYRHIWAHVQAQPGRNLGLTIGGTTSPVRVGKPAVAPAAGTTTSVAETSTDEGPYKLTWFANHDLGSDADELATSTPFDYHERHMWNDDKTAPLSYVDLGYPRIGRRSQARFVLGENIQVVPTIEDDGEDYANDIRVVGAGEGSALVLGRATSNMAGLRRTRTIDRKEITDRNRANDIARRELAVSMLMTTTPSVVVMDSHLARLGTWNVGDEIRVQVDPETGAWRGLDLWFRVVSMTVDPENPNMISMSLLRADLAAVA